MARSTSLIRDYGLTLGLVLASALLFWKTLLPQIDANRRLDEIYREQKQKRQETLQELTRLRALENAGQDPLLVERLSREYFNDLGLPQGEELFGPDPVDADDPAESTTAPR